MGKTHRGLITAWQTIIRRTRLRRPVMRSLILDACDHQRDTTPAWWQAWLSMLYHILEVAPAREGPPRERVITLLGGSPMPSGRIYCGTPWDTWCPSTFAAKGRCTRASGRGDARDGFRGPSVVVAPTRGGSADKKKGSRDPAHRWVTAPDPPTRSTTWQPNPAVRESAVAACQGAT